MTFENKCKQSTWVNILRCNCLESTDLILEIKVYNNCSFKGKITILCNSNFGKRILARTGCFSSNIIFVLSENKMSI